MKYFIVTLGCPKNQVDSEGMHSILSLHGHVQVEQAELADVVVVNTCSFIAAAREETLDVLRDLSAQKVPGQQLIAAGCMAESHPELVQSVLGVDDILSTRRWMDINKMIRLPGDQTNGMVDQRSNVSDIAAEKAVPVLELQPVALPREMEDMVPEFQVHPLPEQAPVADWRTTPVRRLQHEASAYLKISDGCNLRCAFCSIPSFKGMMRSKSVAAILGEAQELVEQGVREIVLVAQHLTDYGHDLKMKDGLSTLLDELCMALPTSVWLRLMYAYPHGITPRLIETMARHSQICAYLDMPLQHAHPDTLHRMHRSPNIAQTKAMIHALRDAMPDISLRSTFIVGFPGETKREFQTLLSFLEEVHFDHVGAFRYSREPGTQADTLKDHIRPSIIERRWHTLMQLQQNISLERNRRWQGRKLDVLVEGKGMTDQGLSLVVGRSFRDAPEVDGQVFVWGDAQLGSVVQVHITQVAAYDLWGEITA